MNHFNTSNTHASNTHASNNRISNTHANHPASFAGQPVPLSDDEIYAQLKPIKTKQIVCGIIGNCSLVFMIAMIFLIFFSLIVKNSTMGGIGILLIILSLILGCIFLRMANKCQKLIRAIIADTITRGVLAETFELSYFDAAAHISDGLVRASRLVDRWSRFKGEDYFAGRYKGRNVCFSDITLTHTESSGNSTHTVIDFKGPWMICDFAKNVPAQLRLRERNPRDKGRKTKSTIETENELFNKKFQILSQNDHTVFYVLTPHFMEYICHADNIAQGQTLLWFVGNQVHIALNNGRDTFRITGSRQEIKNLDQLRNRFRADLRYLTAIIDVLCQNDRFVQNNVGYGGM
ncbi:MAG: DUF3137 domain-containing protein [Peptococcaceae bacterium]|nr:DUF3137 domain-containing protein [Peptococcaceae bacterium]